MNHGIAQAVLLLLLLLISGLSLVHADDLSQERGTIDGINQDRMTIVISDREYRVPARMVLNGHPAVAPTVLGYLRLGMDVQFKINEGKHDRLPELVEVTISSRVRR
ncbi:PilY2 family type 4a fimbrial biogenesis protein [Thioalkalivibrio sulfidiphilus]|uniref:PilY2 family type 4a fimbrial biogenesis protein n=1 Tax=Thioalkalivibrio sulfidiphilus TaxID=1033854 RepID=UPI0011D047E8|nr:PilY2 family type 4a fimbrial biogenesis protein [Thioalkalivibrio sulfidiphilus]